MHLEKMIEKYLKISKEKLKDLNKQRTRQLRIKNRKKKTKKESPKYDGTEK
ncbi:hypothetical protein SAMN02745751_01608 [Dethiosulfatibacter aminovorans DSM 17477]|uniref:Uncharacterized protein n=1 Tax=Dethiosulfatibacter aminovorans DSM 17477 TaxID=1121476 RepID=A0A1M6G0G3_9FIRM|nr:hypothetical protein [Dethiosulfatibacter aminovorans]SHJ03332.1 hypothetical protein SAMN02745751_01608 [Dethiosulfatibacter aminovorans DSM 17477]